MTVNASATKGNPLSGFDFDLQNAIAKRGGFTFHYVLVDDPGPTESFTHWLSSLVPNVDIVATDWYSDTITRRNVGLGFTQEIVDASLILVTTQSSVDPQLNYWSFATPFAPELWGALIAVLIVQALVMFFFGGDEDTTLFKSLYLSICTICQVDVSACQCLTVLCVHFHVIDNVSTFFFSILCSLMDLNIPWDRF